MTQARSRTCCSPNVPAFWCQRQYDRKHLTSSLLSCSKIRGAPCCTTLHIAPLHHVAPCCTLLHTRACPIMPTPCTHAHAAIHPMAGDLRALNVLNAESRHTQHAERAQQRWRSWICSRGSVSSVLKRAFRSDDFHTAINFDNTSWCCGNHSGVRFTIAYTKAIA